MAAYNNYKRNLVAFILPWGYVLMKNCDVDGEFLTFKTVKEYKDQTLSLWLLLKLHLFRDHVSIQKDILLKFMFPFYLRMGYMQFILVQNV